MQTLTLQLQNEVTALQKRVRDLEKALAEAQFSRDRRVFAAASGGEVVTIVRGQRVRRTAEVMLWQPPARG